jgi:hypothetical protein
MFMSRPRVASLEIFEGWRPGPEPRDRREFSGRRASSPRYCARHRPRPPSKSRHELDDAWSRLPDISRSLLAERILKAARDGERDPVPGDVDAALLRSLVAVCSK